MTVAGQQALFIDGKWQDGSGDALTAEDPCTGNTVWQNQAASTQDVDRAVRSARGSFSAWSTLPLAQRIDHLKAYAAQLDANRTDLVEAIALDAGKPNWEADTEVGAMVRKVDISINAHAERTGSRSHVVAGGTSELRHRAHGVLGVLGPFNFPGHLPNGHIVPALLAGNTVVFKPSEQTPLTAALVVRCFADAGLPEGVVNLVQGAAATGKALAAHAELNGLLFTGSAAVGTALHKIFGGSPEKILALEMGGNNPLVAWSVGDINAAAATTVQSAFLTAGQRCTCARRLIVEDSSQGGALLDAVAGLIDRLIVGPPDADPEPFMGPVISNRAADTLLDTQKKWVAQGGSVIRELRRLQSGRPFVSAGLVDVTALTAQQRQVLDEEWFGPLLQVIRVPAFADAIAEANRTRFGLAAGLLSDDVSLWQQFSDGTRAGIVNWNRQTTGAASDAPFGGIGQSGNHRPAAYYAADYCAYPVASMQSDALAMPAMRGLK